MNNVELLDNPSEEITSEGLNWEPEYRCPNCDNMYDGCYCQYCGYNNNGGM